MKNSAKRINTTLIDSLKAGDHVLDLLLKGFGVRKQTETAAPTYFVLTRVAGRLRRITIGKHGSPWTTETARTEAKCLLLGIQTGGNPIIEREAARTRQMTFQELSEQFLEIHGPTLKPTTLVTYTDCIELRLRPKFGSKPINEITHQDVAKAHVSWKEHKTAANNALTCLSSIFGWAEDQKLLPKHTNPCPDIKRYKTSKKERFLIPQLETTCRPWRAVTKGQFRTHAPQQLTERDGANATLSHQRDYGANDNSVRTSMLSRGGVSAGARGLAKPECAV